MSDAAVAMTDGPASVDGVAVSLEHVVKRFGDVIAVDGVDLQVREGEFFSMLGPSGSGKTTCLRMIAGFEQPTEGRILLGGTDVSGLPPYQRDVNTVFQDYALFPHMTVAQNVAYGLMIRKVSKADRTARVNEALEMVRLGEYGDRKPGQLSGGQRQRVALARALIMRPRVLLLDEPLGALDLKLRQQMQIELKDIQQDVGLTFIYVTHDQEEALTMSDRLAVFNRGKIEQVGTPGRGVRASVDRVRGRIRRGLERAGGSIGAGDRRRSAPVHDPAREDRARRARRDPVDGDDCSVTGHVREVVYLGAVTRYIVELDEGGSLVVMQQNLTTSSMEALQVRGKAVRLIWRRSNNRPVDAPAGASEGSLDQEEARP